MRLIEESIDGTHYLEVILNDRDCDKIRRRGICTEFFGTNLQDKYLNIFIRNENTEKFYAIEEGPIKQSGKRERKRINGNWTASEAGCSDQPEESGQI